MTSLGLDVTDDSIKDTPSRVCKMYVNELFEGLYSPEPVITEFNNTENYNEIISNSFTIYSLCEHHFVPIECKVHIGYIPDKKICGISKLIRISEWFAHRPQIQERLTIQIVDFIENKLEVKGAIVFIEGRHFCEIMRGVKKIDSVMRTSAIRGVFFKDEVKQEFFKLIGK